MGGVRRFTGAVQKSAAAKRANYVVEAYRRESTPQYGGDDLDRTTVHVRAVEPSADGWEVRLRCDTLRAGFVYEFHLEHLAPEGTVFFPDEAHYTLKRIPPR